MAVDTATARRYRELAEQCGWSFRYLGKKFGVSSTTADAMNRGEVVIPEPIMLYMEEAAAALADIPVPVREPWTPGTPMEFSTPPGLIAAMKRRRARLNARASRALTRSGR
jgi:hypothetical protein